MSGISGISVNTGEMKKAHGYFVDCLSECRSIKGRLDTLLSDMHVVWSGSAAVQFRHTMDEWNQRFSTVLGRLDSMTNVLDQTIKRYEAQEQAAQQAAGTW